MPTSYPIAPSTTAVGQNPQTVSESDSLLRIDLGLLLEAAELQFGLERLFEKVQAGMRTRVYPLTLEQYLALHQSVRGAYERARNRDVPAPVRRRNLAICIRKMGLDFRADFRTPPWDFFPVGATVLVLVGVRRVVIPEVSKQMNQKAVGARDVESLIELSNLLGNDLRTGGRLEVQLLSPDLPRPAAEALLDTLRRRPGLGAIVALGSPITNRLCDPMARAILGTEPPPVRFRWSHARKDSTLSDPNACAPRQEGISSISHKAHIKTEFPRTNDDEVLALRRKGRRGPFPDCGILMMDCARPPFLILAAGHGGCGTKACVRALGDQDEIGRRLSLPERKLFEVIVARRTWSETPSANCSTPTDCLDLVPPKGWSFGWEDPGWPSHSPDR